MFFRRESVKIANHLARIKRVKVTILYLHIADILLPGNSWLWWMTRTKTAATTTATTRQTTRRKTTTLAAGHICVLRRESHTEMCWSRREGANAGGREVRKMRGKCWKSVAIAAGRNVWHLSTTLTVFRQFLFSFCTLLLLYFLNEAINLCILFIYQQISRLFPTWFPDSLHALSLFSSLSFVTLRQLFQSVDWA